MASSRITDLPHLSTARYNSLLDARQVFPDQNADILLSDCVVYSEVVSRFYSTGLTDIDNASIVYPICP